MKEFTQEMLALAAKGNQYAIEDLYRLTYNSVYKAAKALIQDEDMVLDIVQDSYIKGFQSLEEYLLRQLLCQQGIFRDSPQIQLHIRKIAAVYGFKFGHGLTSFTH